ncbi:MAG: hypothetical protein Q8M03_07980 [Legionella sp.]|nr:hypothetical protein [Legionella sp.]
MFEIYRTAEFVLYCENKDSDLNYTHVLRFQDLSTGMFKSLWINDFRAEIQNLQQSKNILQPDEYNHEVACFIENRIKTGGLLSSLEIASSLKDILRHHKNPQALYDTLNNIPLSDPFLVNSKPRRNEKGKLVRTLELVKSLKEFICNSFTIVNSGQDLEEVNVDFLMNTFMNIRAIHPSSKLRL